MVKRAEASGKGRVVRVGVALVAYAMLSLPLATIYPPLLLAQQPAAQPIYSVNAKATQGVGPGNWTYGAVVPLYVSPTGSDTSGNGTQGNPYATIPRALQDVPVFVSQDYVIHLAAGTYYGEVDVTGRYFGNVTDSLYKAAITFQGSTAAIPATPSLSSVAGGALGATTYYVKVTYTNSAGETDASAESSKAVAASNLLVVTSPSASGDATGYNVYVSTATGTETKQNASPIAIGTNWTEPTTGLISGAALPTANTMGDAYIISGATTGAPTTPSANYGVNCTNANCIMQGVSVQYGVFAGLYVVGGNAVTYNSTYRHMTNFTAFGGNAGSAVLVRNFGTLELAGDSVVSDSGTGLGAFDFGQVESNVTGFDIFGTGWPVNNIVSITTRAANADDGIQVWDRGYMNVAGTVSVTGDNTAGQIGISAHEGMAVFQYLNVSSVPMAVRAEASAEVFADYSTFTNCAVGWSVRDFSVGNMYEADSTFTGVTTPYDIADGSWVIRGSANGGATQNQFDGDLETPAGKSITLLPGSGNVGIGTSLPGYPLDIYQAQTNNASTRVRLRVQSPTTATSTGTYYNIGTQNAATNQVISSGVTNSGYIIGLDNDAYVLSTGFAGTLASQYAEYSRAGIYNASSTAAIGSVYGGYFYIYNGDGGQGGAITNGYGVYIGSSAANGGTYTNRYDLYASTAAAKNYFAGNLGIGDTNPAQAFSVFGKFLVNSSGVATTYNGVALGGNGQPYMPTGGVVDLTAQTATIGATTLFTPSANGLFRISYYLTTTTAGSAGTVSVTFTWTDESKAETFTSSTLSLSSLGYLTSQAPLVIYAKTTAPIQYSTTVSGATGSPAYSLHVRVEAL